MNKASFLSLVRQASRISDQEVEELEKLIVNFPYCQTAHLLIAKAAYDKGSMLSNQKLKKAAIYAANRQLLKKLIYTSDATVTLQAVVPAEPETNTEPIVPAKNAQIETIQALQTLEEELQESQAFVEASVESETLSEPAEKEELIDPENLRVAETPAPDTGQDLLIPAITSEEISETSVSNSEDKAEEFTPETVALQTPEVAAKEEEIPAENQAKETDSTLLVKAVTSEEIFIEAETAGEEIAASPEISAAHSETQTEELAEVAPANIPDAEVTAPENGIDSADKTGEPEIIIPEKAILAEEIAIAEAFEEADIAETEAPEGQVSKPKPVEAEERKEEVSEPEPVAELKQTKPEETAETEIHPSPVLNDDLLHDTLANFDQYLFRPEKETETEEITPEEDLQVLVPENEIEAIYTNDTIGYWMNSSRMGESLEFKNELTTKQPYDFHPELIWEYNKTHELPKEIKPAPSKLSHQLDIIDNFLKMTPRLKAMAHQKVKTEAQEDLSSKSSKISKSLASENFANILVQQGKIKKAIKIYEHLILKIPEKKAYFVSQIEKLQNPE